MLEVVELIYWCGRKKEHFVWSVKWFTPLFYFPLLISVTGACLQGVGAHGSWLGCQVLPTIDAVSILELAANTGNSRMSQAPSLHLAIELLNGKKESSV